MFWLACVSSENYSDYVQEHLDGHNYHVQYHPTERLTDLHPLDPVTIQQDYYLIKTEDPSRNMTTAALLQETRGIGGENLLHANIIYGAKNKQTKKPLAPMYYCDKPIYSQQLCSVPCS